MRLNLSVSAVIEQSAKYSAEISNNLSMQLQNVLKTTCYLSDMDNFVAFNEVYGEYFNPQTAPARSTVAVKTLPKNVLVEVDVIAFKNQNLFLVF